MCAKHNIKVQQLQKEHFKDPPQPMEFIAMDLIGEIELPLTNSKIKELQEQDPLVG